MFIRTGTSTLYLIDRTYLVVKHMPLSVIKFSWKRLSGVRAVFSPYLLHMGFNCVSEKRLASLERSEQVYERLRASIDFLPPVTFFHTSLLNYAQTLDRRYLKRWENVQRSEVLLLTRLLGAAVWSSDDPHDVGYDPQRALLPDGKKDYLVPLTLERLERLTLKGRQAFLHKWEEDTLFGIVFGDLLGISDEEYSTLKYGHKRGVEPNTWNLLLKPLKTWWRVRQEIRSNNPITPFPSPSVAL